MLLIISVIFFILSLAGLVIIFSRHLPQLEALDIATLPQAKTAQTKSNLLEERLKRKLLSSFYFIWKYVRPLLVKIKDVVRQQYYSLLEKEKVLQGQSEKEVFNQKSAYEQESVINTKLEQAAEADDEGLEHKYLEILSLDPKNTKAYENLAKLYYKQKDFLHAREIYEHLVKLTGETIDCLLDIANCLIEEQQLKNALNVLKKALKLEPKNPKILDKLIDVAIMMKDQVLAKSFLKQLKQVNPENQKIKEFKEQIKKL